MPSGGLEAGDGEVGVGEVLTVEAFFEVGEGDVARLEFSRQERLDGSKSGFGCGGVVRGVDPNAISRGDFGVVEGGEE
jgi:hypothetical protein